MKKIFNCICLILFVFVAIGQTQKELDDAMKKLQDVMKDLPPEAKKMMDSLKIEEKLTRNTKDLKAKGITDKQVKEQVDFDKMLVPPMNNAIIAKSKRVLKNDAELKTFVSAYALAIQKKLGAEASNTIDSLYRVVARTVNSNQPSYSSIADLFYLKGHAALALDAYAKEFTNNGIADYNGLNNFSVLCNMFAVTEISLPVLNFLNVRIPHNPIILNNIGQCWYSLGDKELAMQFFQETLNIIPDAPETNETKALICKDNGNLEEAEKAYRLSFKNGFSKQKEQRGKDLGFKLTKDDYLLPEPLPYDPLGFSQVSGPPFQANIHTYNDWISIYTPWRTSIKNAIATINQQNEEMRQQSTLLKGDIDAAKKLFDQTSKEVMEKGISALTKIDMNPIALLVRSYQESNPETLEANLMLNHAVKMQNIDDDYKARFNAVEEEAKKITKTNPCYSEIAAYKIIHGNPVAREKMDAKIKEQKDFTSDILYYYTYTLSGTTLKIIENELKIQFLEMLLKEGGFNGSYYDNCKKPEKEQGPVKLIKWEDTHCKKYYDISVPLDILEFQVDCHGVHLNTAIAKWDELHDENYINIKSSLWLGLSVGKSLDEASPIDVGIKWGQGWYFEYNDKEGYTDFGFQEDATLKAGLNLNTGGTLQRDIGQLYKKYPLSYKDADGTKFTVGSLPKPEIKVLETTSKISYMSGNIKTTKYNLLNIDLVEDSKDL
jgi:tetratricopeptide (TPR) repeat protein